MEWSGTEPDVGGLDGPGMCEFKSDCSEICELSITIVEGPGIELDTGSLDGPGELEVSTELYNFLVMAVPPCLLALAFLVAGAPLAGVPEADTLLTGGE